jgi:hypothetical protein
MAIGPQRSIEVVRHSFASKIGDGPNAIERNSQRLSALGDSGSLHLDGASAGTVELAFLLASLRNMIDGADRARPMAKPVSR